MLGGSLTFSGSSQNAINAGTYTITPGGLTSSNYDIQFANGTLTVDRAALTVTASNALKTYDGLAFTGGNGVSYLGFVNNESATVLGGTLTYAGTSQNAVNAGTYTITPGGLTSGNYDIQFANGTLTVDRAALTVTASNALKTYDGQAFTGGNGVSYLGFVNNESASVLGGTLTFSGTSQNAINAGTYTITPGGLTSGNYDIQFANGTLTVDRAALTVTASNALKTYDGQAFTGGNGVSYLGFVNNESASVLGGTLTFSGTSQNAINAGTYTITPGGLTSGNYDIQFANGTLTVDRAALTVTASNALKTYDGQAFTGGNGVSYLGFVNNESASVLGGSLTYSGSSQNAINAGTYTITPGGLTSGNYDIQFANGTLTVDRASLTVTASNALKTYDGQAFTGGNGVSYLGFVNNESASVLGGTLTFSGNSQNAINAGTYTITPGGLTSGNYDIQFANGTLTVDRAALTITASNALKTYDGQAFTGGNGVSYLGFVNNESASVLGGTLTYSGNSQNAINAGTYTITPGGLTSGNYDIQFANGTLTVDRASLTVTASNALKTYDGQAFTGGNGVSYLGFVNNESATVLGGTLTYSGNSQNAINAGTYTITPGGLTSGNYDIQFANGTLTVDRAALTVTASNALKTYDGQAFTGGNGVSYLGFVNNESASVLGGSLTYSGSSQNAINAGTYTITPGGLTSGNYDIQFANGTLTVDRAALTITASNALKTYDGQAFTGGNGVSYLGFVNNESASVLGGTLTYSGNSQNAINAGTYTITPSGLTSGNYDIQFANGTLTVDRAALTVTASNALKTYDGQAFTGGNGVSYLGFVNNESASVLGGTLTYSGNSQNAINAGTYTITPSGLTSGNYDIQFANGTLTVDRAALTVTASNALKTYDGQAFTGGNGVSYLGFVNNESASVLGGTLTFSGNSQNAINAGTYTITPGGLTSGNYDIQFANGTLTVDRAALTVTASNALKTYDGQAFTGGNGVSYLGFVNNESASVLGGTLTFSGTSQNAINAGTYTITPGGLTSGNYDIQFANGTLSVDRASLTVTANNALKTYDGLAFTGGNGVSYLGFVNNESATVLGGTLTFSGDSQNAINAGTYTITPGGLTSGNYDIQFANGTLTVDRASLTVTANNALKTYDGQAFTGGNGVSYLGFVNNESATVLGGTLTFSGDSQNAINAGTYTITPGGLTSGNYDIQFANGTLTVDRASLTVTASNALKTYDGQAFTGGNGVSYLGFVNNESATVLGGTLTYSGTSQNAINAGSYTITPGGLTSGNYDIQFANGTLTVDRAALTVTASNALKTYDGQAFTGGNGVSYLGFVNNESATVLGGTLTYSGSSQNAINAGTYTITPGGLTSGNYDIQFANGTLSVDRASLTVTANNALKTYDGLAFTGGNGVSYLGFVNNESATVLGGTLTFSGDSQNAINAGTYTITPGGLTSGNYDIQFANGTLTVDRAALTVTASNALKTYDGLAFTGGNGVSYLGFVNNESATVLGGTLTYSGNSQNAINAGTYTITPGGLTSSNYDIQFANGTLSVDRASLTVTANNALKTYDGLAFTGGNGVSYLGFVNNESATVLGGTLTFSGNSQNAINAGTYTITPGGLTSGNYDIQFANGTLTVDRASLTVTASNALKTYDGQAFTGGNGVSYLGFVNNESASVLGGTLTYSGNSQNAINAGTYTITPGGLTSGNYDIQFANGTLTVDRAALTVTANNALKTYDGQAFTGGNGVSYLGFVNNESASVLGGTLTFSGTSQNAINAGTYTITPGGLTSGNYDIQFANGTLTVDRAALLITANNASKIYGETNPAFAATFSGLVPGDQPGVVTGLTFTTPATTFSPLGSYAITPSGGVAVNYDITYADGRLDINKALLIITANPASRLYGQANPTFTVSYSGFVGADDASLVSNLLVSTTASLGSQVGTYPVTITDATAPGYSIQFVPGVLTITPAPLLITAANATRLYGQGNPNFAATFTGLVAGDTAAAVQGLTFTTPATPQTRVGSYAITPSGGVSPNYDIQYAPGTLQITPAPLVIRAQNATRLAGTPNPAFSATYEGLMPWDSSDVVSGLRWQSGTSSGSGAGRFAILPLGASAENYDITYAPGWLTVTQPAVRPTPGSGSNVRPPTATPASPATLAAQLAETDREMENDLTRTRRAEFRLSRAPISFRYRDPRAALLSYIPDEHPQALRVLAQSSSFDLESYRSDETPAPRPTGATTAGPPSPPSP